MTAARNCFAAIDDEQPRLLDGQSSLDEVAEQRVADGLVLGGALPESQRLLSTLGIDAQGDHHAVLGDLDPVKEHGHQIELAEVSSEQLGKLLFGPLDEAARDCRFRGRTRFHFADGFQAS